MSTALPRPPLLSLGDNKQCGCYGAPGAPERDRMSAAVWTANGQAADSLQANTQIVQSVHRAPPAGHTH